MQITNTKNEKDEYAERVVACFSSLLIAVDEAGGSVSAVTRNIDIMTAKQFILEVLGPNKIHFIYRGAKSDEQV